MKLKETNLNCQIPCLEYIPEGTASTPPISLTRHVKLAVRRRLDANTERSFKNYTNNKINRFCYLIGKDKKPAALIKATSSVKLKAGDWVRVRSLEKIESSLNHWHQVRGCTFMPVMAQYCGTTHRVFKHMNRFVDERDKLIKKTSGIILLDGVICRGTPGFGRCDRACLHFWRQEWLEKICEPMKPLKRKGEGKKQESPKVRVRSLSEIEATFNGERKLNGCKFLPEMSAYCNTTQHVLKPLERFVDERDFKVKRTKGILLLKGLMCKGQADFGFCDRSCFYLWRKEWLEMIQ